MHFTAVQMIGTQRSGSNLLRLMLKQLGNVSAPHPPHILERFFPFLPIYKDLDNPENFAQLVCDVCKLIELNPVPWTGLILDPAAIIARCKQPLLTEIFRIIYEMKAESDNAEIWICKSLVNIRFVDQLETHGVNPLYIHLFRDGRDVALSFKKAIVGEKHIYHIAQQWKQEQEASLLLAQQLGSSRVLKVCYEDLLSNPESELRKVSNFIGAIYNPIALKYYHSEESHNTADSGSLWKNVVKPVMTNNFNKFKQELKAEDILLFEQIAGDTLTALGYVLLFPNDHAHLFSSEEIKSFDEANKKLKQEMRLQQKPEDLEKRKKQEVLLDRIKDRLSNKT
jgi:hypothetical protein